MARVLNTSFRQILLSTQGWEEHRATNGGSMTACRTNTKQQTCRIDLDIRVFGQLLHVPLQNKMIQLLYKIEIKSVHRSLKCKLFGKFRSDVKMRYDDVEMQVSHSLMYSLHDRNISDLYERTWTKPLHAHVPWNFNKRKENHDTNELCRSKI